MTKPPADRSWYNRRDRIASVLSALPPRRKTYDPRRLRMGGLAETPDGDTVKVVLVVIRRARGKPPLECADALVLAGGDYRVCNARLLRPL